MSNVFAVITDVHGNFPALQAVLKEIDQLAIQDIHIYCLGDMIGIGPDSNKILETLFSRQDVSMITGNHDEAVLALLKNEPYPKSHIQEREHHRWIANHIRSDLIDSLSLLPRSLRIHVGNQTCFFTHFHQYNEKENLHISENPYTSTGNQYPVRQEILENIFMDSTSYDLVAFGHVHDPYQSVMKHTHFLNPGSLGCNHHSYARFAFVHVENREMNVVLKQVWYDKDLFLQSIRSIQYPEFKLILQLFYGVER